MWGSRPPVIELTGFERLHALERRIYYSPVAVGLALIGIGGCVYWFWSMRRGLDAFPVSFFIAYGLFLISYLGTLAYLYGYRFRRLKCPGCDQQMQAFAADMGEGAWRRLILAFEIEGRYYRRPLDEDDRRPWVRLMKGVRACTKCRTFVDCSRLHQETCTAEELEVLEGRFSR
jgi:hypothetical protein